MLGTVLTGDGRWGLMQRISTSTDAPVVLLSGNGANGEGDLARAFELGADDYVARPSRPPKLVARVGAALRRREAPQGICTGTPSSWGTWQSTTPDAW